MEPSDYGTDRKLILYRLDELRTDVREIKGLQEATRRDVTTLRIAFAARSALWGAVGSLPALIAALVAFAKVLR